MRILHCCPLPTFSGLEQYALLTAKRQKALGHEVLLIVQAGSVLESESKEAGVATFAVTTEGAWPLFNLARKYATLLKSSADSAQPFDVIHLHSSQDIDRFGLAFGLVKFQSPSSVLPKLIQQNHIWISHSKKDPLHWLTYGAVDEIWCSSEPARATLEKFLPVPHSKIKVVNYGRDLTLRDQFISRDEARAQLELATKEPVIGAIARIDPAKGVDELVRAAILVLREGLKFTLVIIGGATENLASAVALEAELRKFLDDQPLEIKARIKLAGPIPNAGRLLKAFDVYAQGSYKETFSLALLDAQLAGLPVVGTSSGGTPEVVIEGRTGWLAKPESVESMAEALKRALKDIAKWSGYGQAAQNRVIRDYDLDAVTDEILSRYKSALRN